MIHTLKYGICPIRLLRPVLLVLCLCHLPRIPAMPPADSIWFYRTYDRLWDLWDEGRYEDMLRSADSLTGYPSPPGEELTTVFLMKGCVLYAIGDLYRSKASYANAAASTSDSALIAYALAGIASALAQEGNIAQAADYCYQSEEKLPSKRDAYTSIVYHNIGLAFAFMENFPSSLAYYKKALAIEKEDLSEPASQLYINCMFAYMQLNLIDSAKYCLSQIHKKELLKKHSSLLNLNIAELYEKDKQYHQAIHYYQKAEADAENLSTKHTYHFSCAVGIGSQLLYQNQYSRALPYFQKARKLRNANDKNTNLAELWHALALTYEGMAAKQTAGTPRQTALRYADSAVSCMVQIQRQFPSEGSKLYLAEKGRKMNRTGLRLANRLYQETGRSTYAEQAFRYAEQGKYAVLSQLLASSPHSLHPAIPDSLKNRYADLNELIASLRYQLQFHPTSRDEGFSQNLRDSIFRCSQQLESLQNHMESTYPDYVQFASYSLSTTLSDFQHYLAPGQVALEYALQDSLSYVFVISRDTICLKSFATDSLFYQQVQRYKELLHSEISTPYSQYQSTARYLYSRLIEPYEPLFPEQAELIIIPDEELSPISFDALLTHDYQANPLRLYASNEPYLLKRYPISYAYSAALLVQREKYRYPFWKSLISYAPDYRQSPDSLAYISQSGPVSRRLARWYLGRSVSGHEATETRFKNDHNYSVINLFAHGRNDKKGNACMYFATGDSVNDSYLYPHEISSLPIRANLITLISCFSGQGEDAQGEGLLSLARSFSLSGCAAVVSSLWAASVDPSLEITEEFYRQLAKGENKSRAMQLAKLKFLETADPVHANPRKWSGLVITGSSAPLVRFPNGGWVTVALVVVLMVGFVLIRRRRKLR